MISKNRATLIGLIAIVLWASIVGLIRGVSQGLGATGGAAMIYTVASVLLLATVGFTRLRDMPRRYLFWGSLLFVSYELCLSLSIGYANTGQQAIEVGMVNYLWPTFTMVAAILFNGQRANWLVVPGLLVSLAGIGWVLGGERGVDLASMLENVQDNPLSYGLAFSGALIWAAYCAVTARMAEGKNGITLFFMLTALALSIFWSGLAAGLNYAVVFVLIQLLHWTVATKQPAVTAPAMAARLKDMGRPNAVDGFVDEVAHLIRSQVAAVIGNLVAVMPTVLLLSAAWFWLIRRMIVRPLKQASHMAYAIADGDPNLFLIERRTKGLVELATNLSGEYAAKTCCVVGVGGKLIRSDKPLVASLVRAINQGSEFVADYPNETARIYSPYSKVPVEDLRAVLGTLTHRNHPSGVALQKEVEFYARDFKLVGVLKPSTDAARFAQHVTVDVLA